MGRLPPMPLLICWFGLVSFWNYSSYQSNVLSIRIPDGFFLWLFWMFFLFCFVCLFLFDMVKQVGAGVWGWWGRRGWTLRVKSSRVKWGDGSVTSQPACHGGKQTGGRLRRSSQGYSFATWCPLVSQMTDLDPPVFLISGSQLSRMADQVLMKSLRRLFFFFVNRNRFTFDFYSSPSSFPFPSLPPPPSSSSVFLASSAAYISMAKASISDRWRGKGGDCFTRCSFQNRFAFHGWNCQLIIITYISSYISSHIHIIIYFTYISSYIYFITIYLSIHLESNEMAWQCGVERFPECSALRVACIDSIIIDKISWADIWFIVQLPLLIRNWNRKQNQTKPNCH